MNMVNTRIALLDWKDKMNKIFEVPKKKEKPFPKLMKGINKETYVYFYESRVGAVLISEGIDIIHTSHSWNMCVFEDTDQQILVNAKEDG